jgi:hypothetical protein
VDTGFDGRPPRVWEVAGHKLKRWARPGLAASAAFLILLAAHSKMSAAERSLEARIGPLKPTATLLRAVDAGTPLSSAAVGYPLVPVRWRSPGSVSSRAELEGLVAAVALRAGSILTPGSVRPQSGQLAQTLRPGERLVWTEALAPDGSLDPGAAVEVLVSEPGGKVQVVSRRALVVSTRPVKPDGGDPQPGRVQAELRTGERVALILASAGTSGAQVRLIPVAQGG